MKKFDTINTFDKLSQIDVIEKSQYFTAPYIVDDSKFSPISEALANINGQTLSDSQIAQSYDFPDGKDNGMTLPIGRGRFADIVDLSSEISKDSANLKEDYQNFEESEKRKAKQAERLNMLKATKDVTTSTPSGN